jgi:hypothetical protein
MKTVFGSASEEADISGAFCPPASADRGPKESAPVNGDPSLHLAASCATRAPKRAVLVLGIL